MERAAPTRPEERIVLLDALRGFALLAGIIIFVLQVIASRAWLTRFRFGPLEWLWRSLTYGKRQPLRWPVEAGRRDESVH